MAELSRDPRQQSQRANFVRHQLQQLPAHTVGGLKVAFHVRLFSGMQPGIECLDHLQLVQRILACGILPGLFQYFAQLFPALDDLGPGCRNVVE